MAGVLFAVVGALALNVLGQAVPIQGSGQWVVTLNTALNLFSVYLLVKASRAYRDEVKPRAAVAAEAATIAANRTESLEEKVDQVAAQVLPWNGRERRGCD